MSDLTSFGHIDAGGDVATVRPFPDNVRVQLPRNVRICGSSGQGHRSVLDALLTDYEQQRPCLVVADHVNHHLQVLDPDGNLVTGLGNMR